MMNIPQDIVEVFHKFNTSGRKLFVVGGSVRDHVMNKKPEDFDMATDAMPDEIERILLGYDLDYTGKAFGVIRMHTPNAPKGYEIATFRKDTSSGRNPTVKIGVSIDVDVFRRDFTINALFYDIDKNEVVDLVGGRQDIERKIIRTPGNPVDSFNADPLRIMRGIRFAGKFLFEFDEATWNAILATPKLEGPDDTGKIVPLSQERIMEEFLDKGLVQCQLNYYFKLLDESGILPQIFPGISVRYEELVPLLQTGVSGVSMNPPGQTRTPEVIIAMLLNGNEPKSALYNKLVDWCKMDKKTVSGIIFLLKLRNLNSSNAFEMKNSMVKNNLTQTDITIYSFFTGVDKILVEAFCKYEVQTSGDSLKEEGYVEGEELGKELRRREKVLFELIHRGI